MAKPWNYANCYGYAANKNRWLLLPNGYYEAPYDLLELNPTWKPVSRSELRLGKSYVAFRFGYTDFHFMFRDPKGHWTHKMGSLPVKPISQKEVFHKFWIGHHTYKTYTSKLFLYEVPNR